MSCDEARRADARTRGSGKKACRRGHREPGGEGRRRRMDRDRLPGDRPPRGEIGQRHDRARERRERDRNHADPDQRNEGSTERLRRGGVGPVRMVSFIERPSREETTARRRPYASNAHARMPGARIWQRDFPNGSRHETGLRPRPPAATGHSRLHTRRAGEKRAARYRRPNPNHHRRPTRRRRIHYCVTARRRESAGSYFRAMPSLRAATAHPSRPASARSPRRAGRPR